MLASVVLCVALLAPAALGGEFCQNGGEEICECDFGWTGKDCQISIDFCNATLIIQDGVNRTLDVCGSHGTCANVPGQGANCTCDAGWEGPFCDTNTDACAPSDPCLNGGTCVDLEEPGYVCLCPKWRTGKNCSEMVDVCDQLVIFDDSDTQVHVKPCGDHGNCSMNANGFTCSCDEGWNGTFCEHRIEKHCWHGGAYHPHGSSWRERCSECQCHFGVPLCEEAHWCPQRCLVYPSNSTKAQGVRVGCAKARENCVPDEVPCARENEACALPLGWCFPMGYVMLDQPATLPPAVPTGTQPPASA